MEETLKPQYESSVLLHSLIMRLLSCHSWGSQSPSSNIPKTLTFSKSTRSVKNGPFSHFNLPFHCANTSEDRAGLCLRLRPSQQPRLRNGDRSGDSYSAARQQHAKWNLWLFLFLEVQPTCGADSGPRSERETSTGGVHLGFHAGHFQENQETLQWGIWGTWLWRSLAAMNKWKQLWCCVCSGGSLEGWLRLFHLPRSADNLYECGTHAGFINTPVTPPPFPILQNPEFIWGGENVRRPCWNLKQQIFPRHDCNNISIRRCGRSAYKEAAYSNVSRDSFSGVCDIKCFKEHRDWIEMVPSLTKEGGGSIFRPVFSSQESSHSHACKSYHIRADIPENPHTLDWLWLSSSLRGEWPPRESSSRFFWWATSRCISAHWWFLSPW